MNMFSAQVSGSTSATADGGAIGIVVVLLVVCLGLAVVMIAASWKLFAKAGRPGWAALIPFYNSVVLLQITGRSGWLLLAMIVPFWNLYIAVRMIFDLARVFGRGVGFGFGLLFLAPIFVLILAFGDARYVGPNGSRSIPFPAGGLAHAPTAL
jgi:hypothetical protein